MTKKFNLIVIIISLLIGLQLKGQSSNNGVTLPAPTPFSFVRLYESQPQLYNGMVNFQENLFKFNNLGISDEINLTYISGGVRPSEVPGWVGLGFNLKVGGVITRIVQDLPDDGADGFLAYRTEILNQYNKVLPDDQFVKNVRLGLLDCKQDIFYFNFGNQSGKFSFSFNGEIITSGRPMLKIDYVKGIAQIDSFTITDDNGVKYIFSTPEKTFFRKGEMERSYISSWYLTKVIGVDGNEINYEYSSPGTNYRFIESPLEKSVYVKYNDNSVVDGITTDGRSRSQVIYLSKIKAKQGEIRFATSVREDATYVPNYLNNLTAKEQKLDEIQIFDPNNTLLNKFKFYYLPGESRLMLAKITKLDPVEQIENTVVEFGYNPERFTNYGLFNGNPYASNAIDHWGFYNGINNGVNRLPITFIPYLNQTQGSADRSIIENKTKACILESIKYGTGGAVSFEYESNDYAARSADEGYTNEIQSFSFYYEEGNFDVDPSTVIFTITENTVAEIKKSIVPIGPNRSWLQGTTSQTTSITLSPGTYNLNNLFKTDQLQQPANSDIQTAKGTITFTKKIPRENIVGPGLRVKKVLYNFGNQIQTKQYRYTHKNSNKSTGILSSFPLYTTALGGGNGASGFILSSSRLNENSEDLPIGYSRVEEILDDNSKIVHWFTNYVSFPDGQATPLVDVDEKLLSPISNSDFRGKEYLQEYYNAAGILIKKVKNVYTEQSSRTRINNSLELKNYYFKEKEALGSLNLNNNIDFSLMQKRSFADRFIANTQQEVLNYTSLSDSVQEMENFYYDSPNDNYLRRKVYINSNNENKVNYFSYPNDFNNLNVSWISDLRNSQCLSKIIENVQTVSRLGKHYVSGGVFNKYFSGGKGNLQETYFLNNEANLDVSTFKFSHLSKGTVPPTTNVIFGIDNRYFLKTSIISYTPDLNIREIRNGDDAITTYLWGYSGQYPIAEIKNATYSEVATALTQAAIDNLNSSHTEATMETLIRDAADKLRTDLPKAMVSSYTYKPLVGMTSKTDPRGIKETYTYDGMQRLQAILDHLNNVTKSVDYHYRSN